MWGIYSTHSHKYDLELHRKYGKLVRVAPNILCASDTAEWMRTENGELMPDTFVLKDKVMHTRMKRNAANAYTLNALVSMEP